MPPDPGVRAVLALEPGIYLGDVRINAEQVLGELVVEDAQGRKLALGALDPVVFSELVYDLDDL